MPRKTVWFRVILFFCNVRRCCFVIVSGGGTKFINLNFYCKIYWKQRLMRTVHHCARVENKPGRCGPDLHLTTQVLFFLSPPPLTTNPHHRCHRPPSPPPPLSAIKLHPRPAPAPCPRNARLVSPPPPGTAVHYPPSATATES